MSFNTTASFVANTNWQFYAGETTMSNFSQMAAGLAVQNFASSSWPSSSPHLHLPQWWATTTPGWAISRAVMSLFLVGW